MPLHQEPGQKPNQPGKGWPGLPGKCGPVKPAKHGHSQAFLATLAAKAWPSWPCYFRGRAFSATLVIKSEPNPGLNYSSQAWPGFFEFPGQKFITLRDCNMNTSESLAICCLLLYNCYFSQRMTHCQFPGIFWHPVTAASRAPRFPTMSPFMFFAFPSQFLALANRCQARPGWAYGHGIPGSFLSPGQHGQSPATSRAHPSFQARLWPRSGRVPDARVTEVDHHVFNVNL